jgi:hypothetical protein
VTSSHPILCPPRAVPKPLGAALSLLGLALALGCGETIDALESGDTFGRIYESLEEGSTAPCSDCHAPGAPGRTAGIETTQDWSTRDTAYTTLRGEAAGLVGNTAGCNGVPLIGSSAETSLLVAALDETVRLDFVAPGNPDCNADAVADQTLKIGGDVPGDVLQELKDWIDSGAP